MPLPVFILYAPGDLGVAETTFDYLRSKGVACAGLEADYLDPANWSLTLLILSLAACETPALLDQVGAAIAAETFLLPMRVENFRLGGEMKEALRGRYIHEAVTPGQEAPLEQLVRMIKPLLHGRSISLSDATSISRTLPSRAAVQREPERQRGESEADDATALFINFPCPILSGYVTTLEFRVENSRSASWHNATILLESRGLKRALHFSMADLPAGDEQTFSIEAEPHGFGQFGLHVTLRGEEDGSLVCFSAVHTWQIHEAPGPADFPRVLSQLAQALGGGTDSRSIVFPPEIASAEQLAAFRLPDRFERLDLRPEYRVSPESMRRAKAQPRLTVPNRFCRAEQAGTMLRLSPLGATTSDPHQDVRLVARSQFVLGRSGVEADYVLWFWPRSEMNDTKTRRISKRHVTLDIEGDSIFVSKTAAASLTSYDGQSVTDEGVEIRRRGLLNLSGIYLLDVRYDEGLVEPPVISNVGDLAGFIAEVPARLARGCVSFSLATEQSLPQSSVWMLSEAIFGRSGINSLMLDTPGLDDIQGRFHYLRGSFWLESLVDNQAVALGEHPVTAGEILPLASGQTVRLGSVVYGVTVTA